MNWNKAKTVLIIAFIVLNLILGLAIYTDRNESYKGLNLEFGEKVKENLEKENIFIEADIPNKIKKLPLLEVEYSIIDEETINQYLGSEYEETIEDILYTNDDGSYIKIENNKKLIYNIRVIDKDLSIIEKEALDYIKEFIQRKNINLDKYKIDLIIKGKDIYEVLYKKIYNDNMLENDYYKFIVDDKGVVGFEMQRINNIQPKEGLLYLTSPYEALLRLKNDNKNKNLVIKEMKICYYTNENVEGWNNIVKANMDPTWKIITEEKDIKYLIEIE